MELDSAFAILFSDIRGFSSYTAEVGDRRAYKLSKAFVGLIEEQVDRHDGRVLKSYGDGLMTSFLNAERSVSCSVNMQKALRQHNQSHPEEQISAGIGLAWGEAIQEEDDLFGHSVNVAKRLADYAKGGQIVVSSGVKEQASDAVTFRFDDLGWRTLKGVGRQRLYELIWRSEIARLSTKDDNVSLLLTDDDRLVMEFSKRAREKIAEVREKAYRAQEKMQELAEERGGLTGRILRRVSEHLGETLPKALDKAIYQAGMGLEHTLRQVDVSFEQDGVVVDVEGYKRMRLDSENVDLSEAREFLAKLRELKSRLRGNQSVD